MEQGNCNTKKRKYTHLKEKDRYKIEVLLQGKKSAREIAAILGRDKATIYREKERGTVSRIQSDLREKKQYRANFAQNDYKEKAKNKERTLKIGKDKRLEEYIRKKIIKDRFSPDAIIGEIKEKRLKFKGIICTKTLYNYIDAGIFSGISNENLWEKRKRKKRGYKTVARVSCKNRMARSIEDRAEEVNNRIGYGHWEGDCVKGPLGTRTSLFTLTERKSLEEIIIKLEQATQEEVQKALDGLEKKHGADFKVKFKTITFDNGSEFLDWKSLEVSILEPGRQRITTYFAHAYSSWERGTNENQNRMIRRFIPKGTDIAEVSEQEIKTIETWMNNYPRKILGYKTAKQIMKECLQGNSDLKLESVAL
ncbi:MAG: IS30 family transposase [Candidatus Omnitrophica bacterium]|nr:IS30 family transposase [Candidatus Omnitrophota bacterium]